MFMKAEKGRKGWVNLFGRKGILGVVDQENIERLNSLQRMKRREGNKAVRNSDHLLKKSLYREEGLNRTVTEL